MRRGVGGGDRPAANGAIQWHNRFGSEGKWRGGETGSREVIGRWLFKGAEGGEPTEE
jgi:hypothetical protein